MSRPGWVIPLISPWGRRFESTAAGGLGVEDGDFVALDRRRLRALHLVGHSLSMLVRRFFALAHRLLVVLAERRGVDAFTWD
jgi:hypothetical protein